MFGGSSFVSLSGTVKLAQAPAYPPAPAAAPVPAPAAAPAPAAQAPMPVSTPPVTSGMSRGAQVAIAASLAGLSLLGAIFLTD